MFAEPKDICFKAFDALSIFFFFFQKGCSNNYLIFPNFMGKVEILFYFVFLLGESKHFHISDNHYYLCFWNFLFNVLSIFLLECLTF